MPKQNNLVGYLHTDKIIFGLSLLVCAFWYSSQHFNIYSYAVTGAIFELLAIPMLLLLILLPVICILLLIKKGFSFKALSFYSLLILVTTILLLVVF